MTRATFLVEFPPETQLPPMDAEDGYQLQYTEGGVLKGGYACVGYAPPTSGVPTQIVWVDTSPAVNALMKADARYVHVEDLD